MIRTRRLRTRQSRVRLAERSSADDGGCRVTRSLFRVAVLAEEDEHLIDPGLRRVHRVDLTTPRAGDLEALAVSRRGHGDLHRVLTDRLPTARWVASVEVSSAAGAHGATRLRRVPGPRARSPHRARSRSPADMPPHVPYGSRVRSANSRHSVRTEHDAHTCLAAASRRDHSGSRSPAGWKKRSGRPRQAASSCQHQRWSSAPIGTALSDGSPMLRSRDRSADPRQHLTTWRSRPGRLREPALSIPRIGRTRDCLHQLEPDDEPLSRAALRVARRQRQVASLQVLRNH
jgi:hypothetical protein